MAPGAVVDDFSSHDGQALEVLSDKIDDVNVIKYDEKSKFDTQKDKKAFRHTTSRPSHTTSLPATASTMPPGPAPR
ncbi:hypothetical protein NM208_g11474 [Fusarium decemcellulare]|uniref:Uncharacterized protein n=1 Tax=Fusarium decemcellulare TaxID=57161 RepID=A0ACC1RUU2_9HYPO|nr:hypothetical protein NM208_g11474 [Fusarium decemcellulare]